MARQKLEKAKHCKECDKIIRGYNKSGYCSACHDILYKKTKKDGK